MREKLRTLDRAVMAVLAAALISFAFWFLVVVLGFHEAPANKPDNYETYFQQSNWWPFPIFFLTLAPGLGLTESPILGPEGNKEFLIAARKDDG